VKEFDFVKLTLGLAAVLVVALGVLWFELGRRTKLMARDIKVVETICKDIGRKAKDIRVLEEEKRNDKMSDTTEQGIHTFFQAQGKVRNIGIEAEDYTLKPKKEVAKAGVGWVDQEFQLEFKKDRPKRREQLIAFIYNCETQSRRIKLQKAKITLVEERAAEDMWRADSLTFTRRDPVKVAE
jgi:hypothetical protein